MLLYFKPKSLIMKFISIFFSTLLCFSACSNDDDNSSLNATDRDFMVQASYSNEAEISAGSIAASKGSADSITMFGQMMVIDHGKAESSLDSLANALSVEIPSTPDTAHIAKAAVLQTLSGYTFDTAYINAQVIDHSATIAIFQKEISAGNNTQVKAFANKNLPIIQMHFEEAQSIQKQLQ